MNPNPFSPQNLAYNKNTKLGKLLITTVNIGRPLWISRDEQELSRDLREFHRMNCNVRKTAVDFTE